MRAHPTSTLDERPGGSKCATRELVRKLHLGTPICALTTISQLIASYESTRPQATVCALLPLVATRTTYIISKPNYLALPLSRLAPSGAAVEEYCLRIVIWLILPVVIRSSQRLSHACLSISCYMVKLQMAH